MEIGTEKSKSERISAHKRRSNIAMQVKVERVYVNRAK